MSTTAPAMSARAPTPDTTAFLIPIEPLQERYSEQWYRRLPEAFSDAGYEVVVIDGEPLEQEVKVGTFLDINSTCHYKATQLQKIAALFHQQKVPDGSVFFFFDVEFWGLEQVRLLAQMNKLDIVITGFLHAASYTKEDAFAIAASYQKYTEVGWVSACDEVYVGSEYHRKAVIERRLYPLGAHYLAKRIINTGNPVFPDEYTPFKTKKKKKFVLTNRPDKEKRPMQTLALFRALKYVYPDWEFVVTTGRSTYRGTDGRAIAFAKELAKEKVITLKANLTKEQYHKELSDARFMVTHSIEENYGYCIAEAIHYGVIPIMRQGLSHNEFVRGKGKRVTDYTFLTKGARSDYQIAKAWIERSNAGELDKYRLSLDRTGTEAILDRVSALVDDLYH